MLISWGQVALAALLAALLTLVLVLLIRVRWAALPLKHGAGLAFCAAFGLALWFFIFNTFSLGGLDFDFPLPLFPVSPEDLSCMLVVGLTAFIYWLIVTRSGNSSNALTGPGNEEGGAVNTRSAFGWWFCLLPALVALVIDVYFI